MAAKNATPGLSDPILNERVGRWDVGSGIRNCGEPDFRTFRFDILEELFKLVQPYLGVDGSAQQFIEHNPVRVGEQEFVLKIDTGVRFGLAPLIKARLNLVHNTLDSDEDGDDGENDEDIVVAAIQDQLQNLSRYERAMPVEFAEEAALMISTYRSLNRPNGSGGEEVQVNLMDWTASFNNEVRKAWKEDVKNKETLRLKMPNQINQAHESMSKKINLQAVLDANEEVKQRMIKCRHDLKTHSPDFRIPDFAESRANAPVHGAPTPSPVQGIGGSVQKGRSILSWNYTLPKSATGSQLQQLIGRRLGILEQTRWCPLCRMKVQEFRGGDWILCSSD